jgi:hypothetical protein
MRMAPIGSVSSRNSVIFISQPFLRLPKSTPEARLPQADARGA